MKHSAALFILMSLAASALAVEDGKEWAIATATRPSDGRVIVYRFIQEYQRSFDRAEFPIRLTLSWRYNSATGMPSVPERESMDMFEDRLTPLVEKDPLASLALVRTGDNLRQWVFYAASESSFRQMLDESLEAAPRLPIEVSTVVEPRWETYEQFVRGIRK